MENNLPFVSVIVPCRDEGRFIGKCLDSIIAQDYPRDKFEVLVIDGMSEDGTRKIVKEYNEQFPFVNLLDNCKRITSSALNKGIKAAKGDIIMIMGSHSTYEKNYMSQCVSYLTNGDADNVGGVCKILPQNSSLVAKSIAYALSSSFGVGNAYYRTGTKKQKYVDTVFGGCYKKNIFDKIGFFDEDLLRTQDSEFNARLIKNGGKILLVPEIISYYYARKSLGELWMMNLQYGYSKPLAVKKVGGIYTLRQLTPPLFVGSLFISLIFSPFFKLCLWYFIFVLSFYTFANLGVSLKIALRRNLRCFFILPLVFYTIHFGWGIGCLKGIWDFIILRKNKKEKIKDLPLTR